MIRPPPQTPATVMIGGDIVAYLFGLLVEYEFGTHASLIAFLALYFFISFFSGSPGCSQFG
jgi:hypothetical protein